MKKIIIFLFILTFAMIFFLPFKKITAEKLATKFKGRILLQVQENGEAWYINLTDEKRYYMGRPRDAFDLMRKFGIGITNADLQKIPIANVNLDGQDYDRDGLSNMIEDSLGSNKFRKDTDGDGHEDKMEILNGYNPNGQGTFNIDYTFSGKHKGKIFLQVEKHGEAWYINPTSLKRHFLGRPLDAFNVMRDIGLGITNENLNKIAIGSSSASPPAFRDPKPKEQPDIPTSEEKKEDEQQEEEKGEDEQEEEKKGEPPFSEIFKERQELSLNGDDWKFRPVNSSNINIIKGVLKNPPSVISSDFKNIRVPSMWKKTNEFKYPPEWANAKGGWFHKNLHIPETMAGQKIKLHFEAVSYAADIYINGQKLRAEDEIDQWSHFGGYMPFDIDITNFANIGADNNILMAVGDANLAKHPYNGKFTSLVVESKDSFAGIWQDVSLISHSKVYIKDVAIKTSVKDKQLIVEATIKNEADNMLGFKIKNEIKEFIFNNVSDRGYYPSKGSTRNTTAKKLNTQLTAIDSYEEKIMAIPSSWENPKLWQPGSPNLYILFSSLEDNYGNIIDTKQTRFGFREFLIDGNNFTLNGQRINLKGDHHGRFSGVSQITPAYLKTHYKYIQQANENFMRIHVNIFPKYAFEMADELGLLLSEESGLMMDAPQYFDLASTVTKNNFEHFFEQWTKRTQNYPSLIMRAVENEIYMNWDYREIAQNIWKPFFEKINNTIKTIDPTRPTKFQSGGDWGGMQNMDTYDTHYPFEVFHNTFTLDYPKNLYTALNTSLNFGHFERWKKNKPYTISEWSPIWDQWIDQYLFYNDKMFDDFIYPQTNYDNALKEIISDQILAYRYSDAAEINPWGNVYGAGGHRFVMNRYIESMWQDLSAPGIKPKMAIGEYFFTINPGFNLDLPEFQPSPIYYGLKKVFSPIAVFINEKDTAFYENTQITRNYAVYNDELTDGELQFFWELKVNENTSRNGHQVTFLKAGYSHKNNFIINLPAVSKKTPAVLNLKLYKDNQLKFEDSLAYTIYPISTQNLTESTKNIALQKNILVYSKGNDLKNILHNWGVNYTEWNQDINIYDFDILFIGKNSADNSDDFLNTNADNIKNFAKNGGQVVLLQALMKQDSSNIIPFEVSTTDFNFTIAHKRSKGHTTLNNLDDNGLKYWRGGEAFYSDSGKQIFSIDHKITDNALIKPTTGNFRSISDCGPQVSKFEGACILELPYYKGNYILNQMLVLDKFNSAPQAAIILKNTLSFALEQTNNRPNTTKTGIILSENNPLKKTIDLLKLSYDNLLTLDSSDLSIYNLIIVDDSASPYISLLQEFTKNGGKVLIQDGSEELIKNLTETNIRFIDPQVNHSQLLLDNEENEIIWGISNSDILWLKLDITGPCGNSYTLKPIVNKVITSSSGISIVKEPSYTINNFPHTMCVGDDLTSTLRNHNIKINNPASALVKNNYGNGFFLINQVVPSIEAIEENNTQLIVSISRFFSTLLTNLGAVIDY